MSSKDLLRDWPSLDEGYYQPVWGGAKRAIGFEGM